MRYEGTVYRPPSEAGSLLIQATIGCPHNRCRFCGMYKDKRFRIRPLTDILDDLDQARDRYGDDIRTIFLPDGNTIVMKTASLLAILARAYENFPRLERITSYGSARFLNLKSAEELAALRQAGLKRIHMGLESGDDETLKFMNKGTTGAQSVEAGRKVLESGMELSVYYLVGIGGRARWEEHAQASARVLNAIAPTFIRLRTYYPIPAAPLYDDLQTGRFELLSPHEALDELEILIRNLDSATLVVSDHVSNYINLTGELPRDKPELLAEIQAARGREESRFRRFLRQL